jgi:hypothetical protein
MTDSLPLVHFYIFLFWTSFSPTVGRAQRLAGWLAGSRWLAGAGCVVLEDWDGRVGGIAICWLD